MTAKKPADDTELEHGNEDELEPDTAEQQLTWMQRRRLERQP